MEPALLAVAKARLPGVPLHLGDMRTFNLGRQFDVVTCLFSSIGYMPTPEDLLQAIANMAGHLAPGGVMLVEPWLSPDRFDPNHLPRPLVAEAEGMSIVRMNDSRVEGRLSIMRFHYLVGRPGKIDHFVEEHTLGLFTDDEYRATFEAAGLDAELDAGGPDGPRPVDRTAPGDRSGLIGGQAPQLARMVASSAASSATAVGLMSVDWTSAAYSSGVTTPVSISTDRAPTVCAARMSVIRLSPMTIASSTGRPASSAAASNRRGSGLPTTSPARDRTQRRPRRRSSRRRR